MRSKGLMLLICLCSTLVKAQVKFAFVTDTHIGNTTSASDLSATVKDINATKDISFVVLTGDITEFGSDEELKQAKSILDSLNKPWYVIGGNHDFNWSESGGNSFRKVFGSETFSFIKGGYQFIGTSSGPNMRMGPGQIPRENIVWLDSVLTHMRDPDMPIIYLNHYFQDSSLNNWYEALDRLKRRNVQMILLGHGHNNRLFNYDGIPSVMGRSNLRAKDSIGGYNIVTIKEGIASFAERRPFYKTLDIWVQVPLKNHNFQNEKKDYYRPSYVVNQTYKKQVNPLWKFQDISDSGSGMEATSDAIISTNTSGHIYALRRKDGKKVWLFKTAGKIYSTPAVSERHVVVGSSDGFIYAVSAKSGQLIWKFKTKKAVLGSPVVYNKRVFIGGSDGSFRAFDLSTGKLVWEFNEVKGFVVTKPLIYDNRLYFGSWGNEFYSLDVTTGKLQWKWSNGSANRMFSPAACYPVASNGKIFIVSPDRYMTCLDAANGAVVWRVQPREHRVRESIGISADGSLIYAKTMDGKVIGVAASEEPFKIAWTSNLQLPYELSPSAIVEKDGVVYVPSHSGLLSAVDRKSGNLLWQYKLCNSLLNPVLPLGNGQIAVSGMDGNVAYLQASGK